MGREQRRPFKKALRSPCGATLQPPDGMAAAGSAPLLPQAANRPVDARNTHLSICQAFVVTGSKQ